MPCVLKAGQSVEDCYFALKFSVSLFGVDQSFLLFFFSFSFQNSYKLLMQSPPLDALLFFLLQTFPQVSQSQKIARTLFEFSGLWLPSFPSLCLFLSHSLPVAVLFVLSWNHPKTPSLSFPKIYVYCLPQTFLQPYFLANKRGMLLLFLHSLLL